MTFSGINLNDQMPTHDERMRALQILQTIMLALLMGAMSWSLKTLIENQGNLAFLVPEARRISETQQHVLDRLRKLEEVDAAHETRISVIEAREIDHGWDGVNGKKP